MSKNLLFEASELKRFIDVKYEMAIQISLQDV